MARVDQIDSRLPWDSFDTPMPELELGFWKASVRAREMPGARDALDLFHRLGLPMAVVSNTSFGERVITTSSSSTGSPSISFVMASSEYSMRKPNVLLFETAAARLNVKAEDIWFVGDRLDTDVAGAKGRGHGAV